MTNGLPALALGIDPADPGHMKEKPRPSKAGLLSATTTSVLDSSAW